MRRQAKGGAETRRAIAQRPTTLQPTRSRRLDRAKDRCRARLESVADPCLPNCRGRMNVPDFRIALANIRFPGSPDDSVERATLAIEQAGREEARIVCFPECFVPGYRAPSKEVPP